MHSGDRTSQRASNMVNARNNGVMTKSLKLIQACRGAKYAISRLATPSSTKNPTTPYVACLQPCSFSGSRRPQIRPRQPRRDTTLASQRRMANSQYIAVGRHRYQSSGNLSCAAQRNIGVKGTNMTVSSSMTRHSRPQVVFKTFGRAPIFTSATRALGGAYGPYVISGSPT